MTPSAMTLQHLVYPMMTLDRQQEPSASAPSNVEIRPSHSGLNSSRIKIVELLSAHLAGGSGSSVRDHQSKALIALRDFLAEGEYSGYISHATGTGKTHIIAELAKALKGIRIVVLSPTKQILSQTGSIVERNSPEIEFSNYYSVEKGDLSAQLINTTYPSFMCLLAEGKINTEEIGMVISDEGHMAIGPQRHRIFRQLPNAIMIGLTATPYFRQLDFHISRNLVREDEPWVGMFRKSIHNYSLDEAIDDGVLRPVESCIIKTGVNVDDIKIQGGEYDRAELARRLDVMQRNSLVIAAIAGPKALPSTATPAQVDALMELHEKIKNRTIAIFGFSRSNIDNLAMGINASGVTAGAVHHRVSNDECARLINGHAKGDIRVILTVDMLKQGWDSPTTSVGIMLKPTYSGVSATQRLGRILRPHESATSAIAIDFVDDFRKHKPILVPNLFDPYYIVRGNYSSNSYARVAKETDEVEEKRGKVHISLSGMDAKTVVEDARISYDLQRKFQKASIPELDQSFETVIMNVLGKNSSARPIEIYQAIVEAAPEWGVASKFKMALKAFASIDSNTAEKAANVLIYLSLKHILKVIDDYGPSNSDEREEMVQNTIHEISTKLGTLKGSSDIGQQIVRLSTNAVEEFIAKREKIPLKWVKYGVYQEVSDFVIACSTMDGKLTAEMLKSQALKISESCEVDDKKAIKFYLIEKLGGLLPKSKGDPSAFLERLITRIDMDELLLRLPSAERAALLHYSQEIDGQHPTRHEIGEEAGISYFMVPRTLRHARSRLTNIIANPEPNRIQKSRNCLEF